MKIKRIRPDALLSVTDYAFMKRLDGILTVPTDVGDAYRIETDLGRYWIWTAPNPSAFINAVIYELGEHTKDFIFNNGALTYDDELVAALLQASGKIEMNLT